MTKAASVHSGLLRDFITSGGIRLPNGYVLQNREIAIEMIQATISSLSSVLTPPIDFQLEIHQEQLAAIRDQLSLTFPTVES